MTGVLPLRLGFLMFPGFPMACLTSAIEPLRVANEIMGHKHFEWKLIAETKDLVRSSAEIKFEPDVTLAECENLDHLYILAMPSSQFIDKKSSTARLRWLERIGVTLGAFSGGIFQLARAGLMAERTCSVHWCYEAAFKAEFPKTQVSDTVILREKSRISASGAGAVFDLMLLHINERLGKHCMTEVACWFQHSSIRDEGAHQKVPVPQSDNTADRLLPSVRKAIQMFESHIEAPIRIHEVAAAIDMSRRHFERLFKHETGQSPLRFYRHLRLRKARQRVLYSDDSLREIATSVGYQNATIMTQDYIELFGIRPKEERRKNGGLHKVEDIASANFKIGKSA